MSSVERIGETVVRILCDSHPASVADAVYLFAQTRHNESSVFVAAKEIIDLGMARKVLLLGSEENAGYPGGASWWRKLVESGVDGAIIGKVMLNKGERHNTLTEALALVHYAKKARYDSLIVSAAPFHQLRAFMTTVTVVLCHSPGLKIFSHPGGPLDWSEPTVHSQGLLKAPRRKLIRAEYERIVRYRLKGDLASFEEVLSYLNSRDDAAAKR